MAYLWIGFAGFLGAILRYSISLFLFHESAVFPFATLSVNLIGSFLLAWFITAIVKRFSIPDHLKAAIGTGFIGSFTTFSTLSVETVTLIQNQDLFLAFVYVFISIVGGLMMSRLGYRLVEEKQTDEHA
ncbi:fluoride efflux transporter CrcB [Mesobacillus subterraneus]|uniref:fluoride efflux transporter CrcB n=1 Tax=Mesobacillus subterraneus TaxID=285983 RepID=UPI00203FDF0E|nr:fluoride efflux transporter CrcB [Mesobacillus subterraneus]MCM3666962.1 fluoride efflux transporter CrcB [Mesobacillus subterraneus]MCM3685793.1 fluoride efflux transporter CrcB [Mesobacillus subterraneus]